jgi:hypothetical protein
VQKRRSPAARELLARHEPAKGRRGARRILQRHLADVIYRAMTADYATWQHQITRHQIAARHRSVNGPLRQYFPRRTDFKAITQSDLDRVAAELNGRPRQALEWKTPCQALDEALR